MQGGSRTEPEASRLAARAFLAHAAQLLVSYKPLALTLPISACVAVRRMRAIERRLPEAKTSARRSMQQSSWLIAVVLCLLPLAHAQA